MLTSGCPSDFHHVQTTALHAHIQWSTACTHLVVHRMHTSSGPPDAAHPVVHRMRHIRWTTSGTFPDAWGCDIRWSTGGQPVDHRMWRSPVLYRFTRAKTFADKSTTLSRAWVVIVRHFNHARRGRALAAISGKVPSVSGVCIEYNKRLDCQRPCLEDDLTAGSNNIVQSNKPVWCRW